MTINIIWERTVFEWKHISVQEVDYEKAWKAMKYEKVVRNKVSSIVAVLPVTETWEFVLIKQYRIPQEDYVLELPAGLWDVEWETREQIAARELEEETWYRSDNLEELYTSPTSSWLTNERITCFIAYNCKKVSETLSLDESEQIEVIEVKKEEINSFLSEQILHWVLVDNKIFALLYHYFLSTSI